MNAADVSASHISSNLKSSGDKELSENASLELLVIDNLCQGPALYSVVYTRDGWVWRTSHRYSEFLALKDSLRLEFGSRHLPDDSTFPEKENMVAIVGKLLASCQGCREGSDVGHKFLEERRAGLEAYFLSVLVNFSEVWDGSEEVKRFFSPGPPLSYRPQLRGGERQGDKVKRSIAGHKSMSSKFFAKVSGGMMSETPRESTSPPNTAPAVVEKKKPSAPSSSASSRLSLISAFKMPSLESVLFDTPSVSASASRHGTSSRHGTESRHGLEGMSRHSARSAHGQRSAFSASKDSSELGTTDSDGSSDGGG